MNDKNSPDFFSAYTAVSNENSYFIQKKGENPVKCYSERSLAREAKILKKKIEDAPAHKKLIWIAPYHPFIGSQLTNQEWGRFFWVSPVLFTALLSKEDQAPTKEYEHLNKALLHSYKKWLFFVRNVAKKDSFQIEFHPCLKDGGNEDYFKREFENIAVRIKTIEHFEKAWQYNFRKNLDWWQNAPDIGAAGLPRPDAIVLGGPSIDEKWNEIRSRKVIWCADTSLGPLLNNGILPQTVFSIDAGRGSLEHLLAGKNTERLQSINLVADCMSFPMARKLPFKNIYSYANSHPLLQKFLRQGNSTPHSLLENRTGDVYGLMEAVYYLLYTDELPPIYGRDGVHLHYKTHLRGSGHYYRMNFFVERFSTLEQYFFQLSRRYR